MGFPAGYTEVFLPKLLLNTLTLLGLLRKLILSFLHLLGLASLVEPGPAAEPDQPGPAHSPSSAALLIREMLPAVRYTDAVAGREARPGPDETCAVCLYEFEGDEEVRCMRNCRHVFHRWCVDRWIDHDRKTCPLCRKAMVPEELQEDFNEKLWVASGIPDFYSEYSPITNL